MAKGKVNLNNLKQTHGALSAPLSIEQLTGQVEGYTVGSLEEYRELLAGMTDEDMHIHAVDVAGVVPVPIRSLLVDRLEAKFISVNRTNVPISKPSTISKKDQEFQRKFMEGQI